VIDNEDDAYENTVPEDDSPGTDKSDNPELVKMLRKLADDLEAEKDVFVVVSAETFSEDEKGEMVNVPDTGIGGKVPDQLDPIRVLVGCVGNMMKIIGGSDQIDLTGLPLEEAMKLLGIGEFAKALNPTEPPNKIGGNTKRRRNRIIRGGFGG